MMKIRTLYKKILTKYKIFEDLDYLLINKELANIWYEKTLSLEKGSVVIFGAGGNTSILLRMLVSWAEEGKIAYIVDTNSNKTELFGIPIKRHFNEMDVKKKLIWISSYYYRKEMKKIILDMFSDADYVDPYEEIKKRIYGADKIDICENVAASRYLWFSKLIKQKMETKELVAKARLSKKLIAGYYVICDWISLRKEIKEYLESFYDEKEMIQSLQNDIEDFLGELNNRVICRDKDDIVIFVIDAMSKYITSGMPLLNNWKKDAVEFTQFKCECANTRESFATLFTGWEPFREATYSGRSIYKEDSNLLNQIIDNDIEVKLLSEDPNIIWDYRDINKYFNKNEENALLSEVLFNGICELLDSNKRQIIIIHSDVTIHYPHLTPFHKNDKYKRTEESFELFKKNFDDAVKYTDRILGFYNKCLDKNHMITQIVMGDHGYDAELEYKGMIAPMKIENDGLRCNPSLYDTGLIIKSIFMQHGRYNELVSIVQFKDILGSIFNGVDPRIVLTKRKSLPVECVPGWDYEFVMKGLEGGNYYYGIGASGLMNKEYVYLHTEEDECIYYKIEERRFVRIDDSDEISKAAYSLGLFEIENHLFPMNLLDDPFFSDHKKAYSEYNDRLLKR